MIDVSEVPVSKTNKAPWPAILLDSVAIRGSGHTPDKKHPEYWGGSIDWVSLKDTSKLDRGLISSTAEKITPSGLAHSSAVLHKRGTVILLRDAGIGKSAVLDGEMAVSQHFLAWDCGPLLYNWFLYYWFQFMKSEFERISNGSTIKTIGLGYFRQLRIPLPDQHQQRHIARALADADVQIRGLECLISKKQALMQGMTQQLLTGKTRLIGFSGKWSSRTLADMGVFLKGRGIKREDVKGSGVPCVRYGELYTTYHSYAAETVSYVSAFVAKSALPIRSGDLLFAGSGETRDEIGTCIAYTGEIPAVAGGDIVVLRGATFNAVYLASLCNTPNVINQKARLGQGDAVVHISSRALASIEVGIPEKPEQDAIAAVIIDANSELRALDDRLAKARAIKQGMMREMLTGDARLPVAEVVS